FLPRRQDPRRRPVNAIGARAIVECLLLGLAWAACASVRPWRLLRRYGDRPAPLVTPFLGCLPVLPSLPSWPGLAALPLPHGLQGPTADLQRVALFLLAVGEASWSCAVVSLLVAYRPQWLATWSDSLYLRRPARQRVRAELPPRR